jgi:hypothetical protein
MSVYVKIAGVLAALAFTAATPSFAASACKGLTESACAANAGCSWVKGFTTKKGRVVKAFCRKKPARKVGAASASHSVPSSKPKDPMAGY